MRVLYLFNHQFERATLAIRKTKKADTIAGVGFSNF